MRPKSFKPREALEKAMQVFWEKGYEATSTQELVDRMGINRSSLYNTFGSKHQLFLAALDHYCHHIFGPRLQTLEAPGASLFEIREFLAAAEGWAEDLQGWQGCLVTNSTVERAPHDPDTAQRVEGLFERMEDGFHRALVEARRRQQIPRGRDLRALARFLTNCIQGLAVTLRRSPGREVVRDIVETTLSLLESPEKPSDSRPALGLNHHPPS